MALRLIGIAGDEPVSLQEAKLNLRLIVDVADTSNHPDDELIEGMIATAREMAEQITGRGLVQCDWEMALPCFPSSIELPKPPTVSVSEITYVDPEGVTRTVPVEDYFVDMFEVPQSVCLVYGRRWPATRAQKNAVIVKFKAGYEPAQVPLSVKRWMHLKIGTLYNSREDAVVGVSVTDLPHVERLLDAERLWRA